MQSLLGSLVLGLSTGSIYALVALGFVLLFQSASVIDFARGPLVMVGSLLTVTIEVQWGLPWPLAVVGCLVVGAAIGALQFLVSVAPLPRANRVAGSLVATLGFGVIVTAVLALMFGSGSRTAPPLISDRGFAIGNIPFTVDSMAVIAVAVLGTLGFWLLLQRTVVGIRMRSVAEDAEAAALRGINVRAYAIGSCVVAGMLATLAGLVIAPLRTVLVAEAPLYTIYGFVAMVVGGTGSVWGALIGGWFVGISEALGTHYLDVNARSLFGLSILLAVLLLRPQGIFASSRLRKA